MASQLKISEPVQTVWLVPAAIGRLETPTGFSESQTPFALSKARTVTTPGQLPVSSLSRSNQRSGVSVYWKTLAGLPGGGVQVDQVFVARSRRAPLPSVDQPQVTTLLASSAKSPQSCWHPGSEQV